MEKTDPSTVEEATYLANFIWAGRTVAKLSAAENFQEGLPVDFRRNQTFQGIMRKVVG